MLSINLGYKVTVPIVIKKKLQSYCTSPKPTSATETDFAAQTAADTVTAVPTHQAYTSI